MDGKITADSKGDVYFVYDGGCPICNLASHALRIRETVGQLHLINARDDAAHPLVREVTKLGYDLDEGMVITFGGRYYHGADALVIMALLGSNVGWFNRMNALLFRSKRVAALLYPAMRGARNALIRFKGVPKLRNLEKQRTDTPIFRPVFGESWERMPPVLQRHYANRPYTDDVVTLEGVMDIALSPLTRLMKPLFKIFGALVPYEDMGIPTTVYSKSEPDSPRFILERHFRFANREPYIFRSVFVMLGGSDVVELMKFGIGWRCDYVFDGTKVRLLHRGYVWRIGGVMLPLPLTWVLGKGYAEEEALDEKHFRMCMTITHPLFAKSFEYKGQFEVL